MRQKADGILIKKTRYLIPLTDRLTIELDVFSDELEGLLLAEVEFETEEEAEAWRGLVQSEFPHASVYYTPLSCSIACHVGVGALGIGVSILLAQ